MKISKINIAQSGYTIIELIVVIILIGIASAFAMSRMLGGNVFTPSIVQQQIISLARIAQQSSLGRSDVTLTITPNGDDTVTIDAEESSGTVTIQSVTISMDSVSFSGDINKTASCAVDDGDTAITSGAAMVLAFGQLGDLEDSGIGGGAAAITSAVRICLNNSPSDSVCVAPSGFAYAGDCDA
jgi:MSHA pilin protein MshC